MNVLERMFYDFLKNLKSYLLRIASSMRFGLQRASLCLVFWFQLWFPPGNASICTVVDVNSRSMSWCKKWFHMKNYCCLKSSGRPWWIKIFIRNFAEMSLSWDMSSNDTKLRKLRNYQKWLAWHSLAVYVWYKVNLLENKPFYQKISKPTLEMS